MAFPGVTGDVARDVTARVVRSRPSLLAPPIRALVIASWIATGAVAWVLILPGVSSAISGAETVAHPRWLQVMLLACCVLLAASVTAAATLERRAWLAMIVIVAIGIVPPLGLAADGAPVLAVTSAAATLAAIAVRLALGARRQAPPSAVHHAEALHHTAGRRFGWATGVGIAAAVPWGLACGRYAATASNHFGDWTWAAVVAIAASFLAVGAFYGVTKTTRQRQQALQPALRNSVGPLALGLVLLLAVAVIVVRLTIGAAWFNDVDAAQWTLRGLASWPHAVLVAVLVALFALRSAERPISGRLQRIVIAVLVVAGTLDLLLFPVEVLRMVAAASAGGDPVPNMDFLSVTPFLAIAFVALLLLLVFTPMARGTAGRALAVISVVYLLPPLSAIAAGASWNALPAFWASPVQVVICLTAIAIVLFLGSSLRKGPLVQPRTILRLALYPLLAVHAAVLLPAIWMNALARALLVVGILAAFLLLLPKVAADPVRHARTLLLASAAQLLTVVATAATLQSLFESNTVALLGTLWLAIPVAAALCLTIAPEATVPVVLKPTAVPATPTSSTGGSAPGDTTAIATAAPS